MNPERIIDFDRVEVYNQAIGRKKLGITGSGTGLVPDGGAAGDVLTKASNADQDTEWAAGGGGGGAPVNAQYLVGAANATLTAERVVTNTTTVSWDLATAAQAKANVVDASLTDVKIAAANKDGAAATPSMRTLGATAVTACAGNDARLSDARTPTAHASTHQDGGTDEISVLGLSGLLADSQNPLAHKTSHQSGGSDAIKLDDLAAPDNNTDLNVSIAAHGLTPILPNDATKYLDGTGAYTVPAGSGGTGLTQGKSLALVQGIAMV